MDKYRHSLFQNTIHCHPQEEPVYSEKWLYFPLSKERI
jgi:hypothetical protein